MFKSEAAIDVVLLTVGSVYSLANIEEVLGVIILFIQLAWIITKLAFKIYEAIKHKKIPPNLGDDVDDTIEAIENIRDALTPEEDNENERNSTDEE